jgi:hypothetical protein
MVKNTRTTVSQLLLTKLTANVEKTTYHVGNTDFGLGQAQICGGIKLFFIDVASSSCDNLFSMLDVNKTFKFYHRSIGREGVRKSWIIITRDGSI